MMSRVAPQPAPEMADGAKKGAETEGAESGAPERLFGATGRLVARRPWTTIAVTFVAVFALASGFATLEDEDRPDKLWVAEGSTALDHQDYVRSTWPSSQRWNFWAAQCKVEGCNMLDAQYVQRVAAKVAQIRALVVDGDALVADLDDDFLDDQPEREWGRYAGKWAFDAADTPETNQSKCFRYGPECAQSSILDIFSGPTDYANTSAVLAAINTPVNGQPRDISKLAGGIATDTSGDVVSASALFGSFTITLDDVFIKKAGRSEDELANKWEAAALCALGIEPSADDDFDNCPGDDLVEYVAQFDRSFGDEFGTAIGKDLSKLGIAYVLMLAYLATMLSRWDSVHSMLGMSVVVLLIVLLSFAAAMGLGSYIGLKNNTLNNNIPFLLLGLGVDDAFVLVSEFRRATTLSPQASVEDRISTAMRSGGMSVLITSATDALAFMVGSTTVLPALGEFCMFAGLGVAVCFFLQIFLFMPCLALNARRAEANRLDCCCCFKTKSPRQEDLPKGCCDCCGGCCGCTCCTKPSKLETFFGDTFGGFITSTVGIVVTLVTFVSLAVVGLIGITQVYKDFKLEWFIPDDSYVQDFFSLNEKYFKSGKSFSVYTPDVDYFAQNSSLVALSNYLATSQYVDQAQGKTDWHASFLADHLNANLSTAPQFYTALHAWLQTNAGSRFSTTVQWSSAPCNTMSSGCNTALGLQAARVTATMKQSYVEVGTTRYAAMADMREQVSQVMSGAFPFSFEFLYWEEIGVIDEELTRNLLICGLIIVVMLSLMIPVPRISILVSGCIILSIMDVVGLLYFWDVTICGVSTIYILICVGLAVDYAAHIAHMFREATGSSKERAQAALRRIGPSVFNALVSTFLAVITIGFSTSYVFRVFFKAFFLVTVVAGAHGLWLLPCLLGLLGGSNGASPTTKGIGP